MSETIDSLEWMDDRTKLKAKDKLYRILLHIAYPGSDIHNDTWAMHRLEEVKVDPTHGFGSWIMSCVWLDYELETRQNYQKTPTLQIGSH